MTNSNNTSYKNWKEYFFNKFADSSIFDIQQKDKGHPQIETYIVKTKDSTNKTSISFQIFKDEGKYDDMFDAYFDNPESPILTEDHKNNPYGFDGIGSQFTSENIKNMNEWLDIPLLYGWTERTTYYDGKELRTDCIWKKGAKLDTIPIKQNFLDKYKGCLTALFFSLPVIIFTDYKLKRNKDKVTYKDKVVKPMLTA